MPSLQIQDIHRTQREEVQVEGVLSRENPAYRECAVVRSLESARLAGAAILVTRLMSSRMIG